MKIGIIDASNYFRGLLLLIRKDRKITDIETRLMARIGKALGFEREFCETAIAEILDNRFIVDVPPEFTTKELAESFIRDGLSIAFADNEVHPDEEEWLKSAAELNKLDMKFFRDAKEKASAGGGLPLRLRVDDITVEHR